MSSSHLRDTLSLLPLLILATPGLAQVTNSEIPLDNQKSRWMNFETAPVDAVEFSDDGQLMYTINQPGARLNVYRMSDNHRIKQIPLGPGLVGLALRPGTDEIWALDQITSTVTIVDTQTYQVLRSLQVSAEPHGIVFNQSGTRAYVSCSAANSVDVIDCVNYTVGNSIDIPAKNPRGLALVGNSVFVAPLLSGNGTAPRGNPNTYENDVLDVQIVGNNGFPGIALPDYDLLRIDLGGSPEDDQLNLPATIRGMGTILFNVHQRPFTTEVWIPNTGAFNERHRGEKNFIRGQVVSNRISILDVNAPAQTTQIIDLDSLAPNFDVRCAQPTGIAFTREGTRAFVCGYGSDSLAVLDINGPDITWAGSINIEHVAIYPDGAGPRVAEVSPDGRWLIVFNKSENSFSRIDLLDLPTNPDFVYQAPNATSLGWDPTPLDIVQGRVHFNRTQNSMSQTSSCGSCHVDGHTDGLAWDLSKFLDPEQTPNDELQYPLDNKGPLVTQSVRSLREVGPFHWRGEKKKLREFNGTFMDLFEREDDLGNPAGLGGDMLYVTQYMERLTWPANPRQNFDRTYTQTQLAGADVFMNKHVQDNLSCTSCHALPLGTSGEIVEAQPGALAPTAVVAPLRGVFDKLTPIHFIGGDFGRRTELGAGLGHGGVFESVQAVALQSAADGSGNQRFDVTEGEAEEIAEFLNAWDTGVAPAAQYLETITRENARAFWRDMFPLLIDQVEQDNCDLIIRYGPIQWMGQQAWVGGHFNTATGRFDLSSSTLHPLRPLDIVQMAYQGTPVTIIGVPGLMGRPLSIDRDNDDILDLDELTLGTNHERTDTDFDLFPDGYELEHGMDPLVQDTLSPDTTAASLLGQPHILYTTMSAVKFEFETDEKVSILIAYNGGGSVLRAPLLPQYDDQFLIVIGELDSDTQYNFKITMQDPAGNISESYFPVTTSAPALPVPVGVENIDLSVFTTTGFQPQTVMHAEVLLMQADAPPTPGYSLRGSAYHEAYNGDLTLIEAGVQTWLTHPSGIADFYIRIPNQILAGTGQVYFVVQGIDSPPGEAPYTSGQDIEIFDSLDY